MNRKSKTASSKLLASCVPGGLQTSIGGCCEEPRALTMRTYHRFPASWTRRMGEAAGFPGSQTLQLRVPGHTQVSARGKKNEDISVKMRALQSSAKGGMHLQPSETLLALAPGLTCSLTCASSSTQSAAQPRDSMAPVPEGAQDSAQQSRLGHWIVPVLAVC